MKNYFHSSSLEACACIHESLFLKLSRVIFIVFSSESYVTQIGTLLTDLGATPSEVTDCLTDIMIRNPKIRKLYNSKETSVQTLSFINP